MEPIFSREAESAWTLNRSVMFLCIFLCFLVGNVTFQAHQFLELCFWCSLVFQSATFPTASIFGYIEQSIFVEVCWDQIKSSFVQKLSWEITWCDTTLVTWEFEVLHFCSLFFWCILGGTFLFPVVISPVFVAAGLAGVSVLYISVHTNEIKTQLLNK